MRKKMVFLVALVFASLVTLSGFAAAVTSNDGNMIVTSPIPESTISSGVTVSGKAIIFEAQFNYELVGRKSGVIASGNARTQEGSVLAPFSFTIAFDQSKVLPGDTGTLRVFDRSMKDESQEISLVEIPVKFASTPSTLALTGGDATLYRLGGTLALIGAIILSAGFFKRGSHR